jgi:hypothetical protein
VASLVCCWGRSACSACTTARGRWWSSTRDADRPLRGHRSLSWSRIGHSAAGVVA